MNKTKHNLKRQFPTWLRVICLTFLATWMGFQSEAQIAPFSADFNVNSTGWTGNITRTTATTACGSASMRRNLYSSVTTGNLVSPSMGTTAGGVITLTYKYKVANWSANTVGTANPWGSFNVQYGATATGPWTTVQTINSGNHTVSGTCTTATATFTPPAGALFVKWDAFWTSGDYYLNFDDIAASETAAFPCSGTPAPGNTLPASSSICGGQGVNLSLQNGTAGTGVTFQWMSSPTSGSGFNPIVGATDATYNPTNILANTYYKCDVTCSAGPSTGTSNEAAVSVTQCTFDVAVNQTGGSFSSIMPGAGGSGSTFTYQGAPFNGDDIISTTVSLAGTNFTYQGQAVTGFQVCSNGWMTFNTTNTANAWTNALGGGTPNRVLAPFWDDLVTTGNTLAGANGANNGMRYFIDGVLGSGTATITIEWAGMEKFGNPGPNLNFQVILFEGSNKVQYQYGGFQPFDGTLTTTYNYSIGYNGTNPAGTTASDRFAMQTAFTNHFSAVSDPANLEIFPPCNSYIEMTPGVHSGPVVAPAIPVPSNDAQGSPILLATNGFPCTDYCGTYYTSLGATNSAFGAAACALAGAEDDDVWFTFNTSVATDYTIRLRSYLGYNGVVELIDASNAVVACANLTGSGGIETMNATGLTPSATYQLRVFDNTVGVPGGKGQFSICVNEVILPPANDNICGAISLTVATTCNNTAAPFPSTLAATASPQVVCGGTADDDVWYSFVASTANDVVTVQGGAGYNAHLEVFSAATPNDCSGTLTSLTCTNVTSTAGVEVFTGSTLVPGETYFVRVYHTAAGTGSGQFDICVTAALPACVSAGISPANASIAIDFNGVNLSWTGVVGATGYDVYFNAGAVATAQVGFNQGATIYATGAMSQNTQYAWKVISKNGVGDAIGCTDYTFTTDFACTTPAPGATLSTASSVCPTTNITLSLANINNGNGISYQWQADNGAGYADIIGATNATYVTTQSVNTSYQCNLTCVNGPVTVGSTPVAVTMNAAILCYCNSTATTAFDEEISGVSMTPVIGTSMSQTSTCATLAPGSGSVAQQYSNYTGNTPMDAEAGTVVNFTIDLATCGTGAFDNAVAIYIDYNIDGDFNDAGEQAFVEPAEVSTPLTGRVLTGSFTVPVTATIGLTGMRVLDVESGLTFSGPMSPCLTYGYGETEDYLVNITAPPACSGAPAPGAAIATPSSVCSGGSSTLTLTTPTPGSGVTYQWYDAAANQIPGATNATYTATGITAATSFYCDVTCATNTTSSGTASISLNSFLTCYCASTAAFAADEEIGGVSMTSTSGTMAQVSGCGVAGTGVGSVLQQYSNYTGNPAMPANTGSVVNFSIDLASCGTTGYDNAVAIFIDYNQNGSFSDVGEQVFVEPVDVTTPVVGGRIVTGSFTVPVTATSGTTGMRIINVEDGVANGQMLPCFTYNYGETEDYLINITTPSSTSLDLNLWLEGYFDGTSAMLEVMTNQNYTVTPVAVGDVDDITVELREFDISTSTYTVIPNGSAVARLHTDGTAEAIFPAAISGNYYVVINHRNHIQTWSTDPVTIAAAGPNAYDFTNLATKAFGMNMVLLANGQYGFFVGDINQDEYADNLDFPFLDADTDLNLSGVYVATDLNGDGFVDSFDFPLFDTNSSNNVQSSHP